MPTGKCNSHISSKQVFYAANDDYACGHIVEYSRRIDPQCIAYPGIQ